MLLGSRKSPLRANSLEGCLVIILFITFHAHGLPGSGKANHVGIIEESTAENEKLKDATLSSSSVLQEYADQVLPYMNLKVDPCEGAVQYLLHFTFVVLLCCYSNKPFACPWQQLLVLNVLTPPWI
jgi:hypothetical protein